MSPCLLCIPQCLFFVRVFPILEVFCCGCEKKSKFMQKVAQKVDGPFEVSPPSHKKN